MFDRRFLHAALLLAGGVAQLSPTPADAQQHAFSRRQYLHSAANRLAYRQAYERYYLSLTNRTTVYGFKRLQSALAKEQLQTAITLERLRRQRLTQQTLRDAAARQEHYTSQLQQRVAADAFRRQSALMNAALEHERRLTSFEFHPQRGFVFHPTTGAIQWPSVFDDKLFDASRRRLDSLFARRGQGVSKPGSRTSGLGSRSTCEMLRAVKTMKSILKSMVRELDPTTCGAANRFLDCVAFEARFVTKPSAFGHRLSASRAGR